MTPLLARHAATAATSEKRFQPPISAFPVSPIEHRQAELIRQMTPARRLELALELYHTAWAVKLAGLRRQHADWTEARIQDTARRIFLTGYAG